MVPGVADGDVILRFYAMCRRLRVFMTVGGVLIAGALILGLRFLGFYLVGRGAGHTQSLILAAILTASSGSR